MYLLVIPKEKVIVDYVKAKYSIFDRIAPLSRRIYIDLSIYVEKSTFVCQYWHKKL